MSETVIMALIFFVAPLALIAYLRWLDSKAEPREPVKPYTSYTSDYPWSTTWCGPLEMCTDQSERIAELERALRPFAEFGAELDPSCCGNDYHEAMRVLGMVPEPDDSILRGEDGKPWIPPPAPDPSIAATHGSAYGVVGEAFKNGWDAEEMREYDTQ